MAGEKTEKATPKRRQDERKKGNIFMSREVVTVATLVAVFYSLKLLGPPILTSLENSITNFFGYTATMDYVTVSDARHLFLEGATTFLMTAMPLLLICSAVAVVFTTGQTRLLFSMQAAGFKMSRLNPIQGLKRMFSVRGLVELLKSLAKIAVLSYIIYNTFLKELANFPRMMDMTLAQSIAYTGGIILSIVQTAAAIMAFLAAGDYLYQWWDYEKNLRMSKEEIKEEYKQTEGDPQIKGKIRERQQAMARRRMMQKVPTADVVIRNPTHYAVAIRYDPKADLAPVVVAKGADNIARRIVQIAEEHDIVITENKPLARGLFEAVDLDRAIPEQFYGPVAEVLAFVYSVKKKDLGL